MADSKIILGNKRYSSWSLRGWLAARLAGLTPEEVVIPLRQADTRARILSYSPAGKVPTLVLDGAAVWDSLAIGETLAERFPKRGLWPADPAARARARSISAEMHSGFPALRGALPMDIRSHFPGHALSAEVQAEVDRIQQIWQSCRQDFGQGGDFLFGAPSLADAFYAPVVTRFRTYDVKLDPVSETYCATVEAWPLMRDWAAAAAEESWIIDFE